jgi:hypothetical protein
MSDATIRIEGTPVRYEARFPLVPVALDFDGEYKPLGEITFTRPEASPDGRDD